MPNSLTMFKAFALWAALCMGIGVGSTTAYGQNTPAKTAAKPPIKPPVKTPAKTPAQTPVKTPLKTPVKPPVKSTKKASVKSKSLTKPPVAKKVPVPPKPKTDTTRLALKEVLPTDTARLAKKPDTVKVSNDLNTTVVYTAEDSIVFSAKTRIARLYGNADITYGDVNLKASEVKINYQTNLVDAKGAVDTAGRWRGMPIFTQGSEKFQADSMRYNFRTRKGLIKQVITQQGDGYIHGEAVKRESETALYIRNAEYTTCNLAHPHFYIKSYKMKMIPGKKIVSGPFNLHIADVPTPLGFVFGFFPIPKFRSSGLIIPTYGESAQQGFFLRNGGVYLALSDYFDLKLLGEIYTLGGWGLTPQSVYKKRYRYDGVVNLLYNARPALLSDGTRIQNAIKEFRLNWSHTPVPRGNSRFSASVNVGTNGSNRRSFNINQYVSTTFLSNVNYSATIPNSPFSLASSIRISQDVARKTFNLDLPTLALTMNRIFPFKRAGSTANNALTNLSLSYALTSQYSINNLRRTGSDLLPGGVRNLSAPITNAALEPVPFSQNNFGYLLKNAQFGVQHSVPISTTFRAFKYINISPAVNFREIWYASRLNYRFDKAQNGVFVDTARGFNRFYDFNTSASASTQVYGTFFVRKGGVEAIRHRMTPTVSFGYRPDFGVSTFGFFQKTQVDSTGRSLNLNPYASYLYGGPSSGGRSAALSFSLTNVLEAKVRQKGDSGKNKFVKKNILENLSLAGGYNFLADSFKLSAIRVGLNTRVLNKVTIASNIALDPYEYENRPISGAAFSRNEVRRKAYALEAGQGLGKITNADLSLSFSLNPSKNKKEKTLPKKELSEAERQELSFINANPDLFVDFNTPWNINFQYLVQYYYRGQGAKTYEIIQNLQISGDLSLTPKWKIGYSAPFDFQTKKFASTSINIYRDLHCWEMRMGLVVAGTRPSYQFDINVKASILQDLKLSRRNSFYDR